jgi:arylsulfatase A-like enzyme
VRSGEVDAEQMRDVYAENVDYVLNSIEKLIESVDGKKVITSDHGELLGESFPKWKKWCENHPRWGSDWEKYDWGHSHDVDVPALVDVPWLELPHGTRRKIISESPVENEFDDETIEEHLEALGYR